MMIKDFNIKDLGRVIELCKVSKHSLLLPIPWSSSLIMVLILNSSPVTVCFFQQVDILLPIALNEKYSIFYLKKKCTYFNKTILYIIIVLI